jgi:polysaccharide biosynthesis/export protein
MLQKLFLLTLALFSLMACSTKKDILYFQNLNTINSEVKFEMPKIQVNDILNIKVTAENQTAADVFNISGGSGGQQMLNAEILKLTGYLVNEMGEVSLPVLGKIKVTDYTINELEQHLITVLIDKKLLTNPNISIRVVNAKVNIMGEVKAPGLYTFTEQVITLPQALGMAGDLTINGQRKGITIIREQDGQRLVGTVDLTDANLFSSPFYYIKQNDVIIVQPNGPKVMSSGYVSNVGTILGLGSFILTITLLLTR